MSTKLGGREEVATGRKPAKGKKGKTPVGPAPAPILAPFPPPSPAGVIATLQPSTDEATSPMDEGGFLNVTTGASYDQTFLLETWHYVEEDTNKSFEIVNLTANTVLVVQTEATEGNVDATVNEAEEAIASYVMYIFCQADNATIKLQVHFRLAGYPDLVDTIQVGTDLLLQVNYDESVISFETANVTTVSDKTNETPATRFVLARSEDCKAYKTCLNGIPSVCFWAGQLCDKLKAWPKLVCSLLTKICEESAKGECDRKYPRCSCRAGFRRCSGESSCKQASGRGATCCDYERICEFEGGSPGYCYVPGVHYCCPEATSAVTDPSDCCKNSNVRHCDSLDNDFVSCIEDSVDSCCFNTERQCYDRNGSPNGCAKEGVCCSGDRYCPNDETFCKASCCDDESVCRDGICTPGCCPLWHHCPKDDNAPFNPSDCSISCCEGTVPCGEDGSCVPEGDCCGAQKRISAGGSCCADDEKQCCDGSCVPEDEECNTNPDEGGCWGDPHFVTMDGNAFDFQGLGEYVGLCVDYTALQLNGSEPVSMGINELVSACRPQVRSEIDVNSVIDIHIRTAPFNRGATVTVGVAIVDPSHERGARPILFVAGKDREFAILDGNQTLHFNSSQSTVHLGLISVQEIESGYQVVTSVGLIVSIIRRNWWFDWWCSVPNSVIRGHATGLLGLVDGDPTNDFTNSTGQLVRQTRASLYKDFGQSWKIQEQNQSLFYNLGDFDSYFTESSGFVPLIGRPEGSADTLAAARAACLHLSSSVIRDACIYDFIVAGGVTTGFIEGANDVEGRLDSLGRLPMLSSIRSLEVYGTTVSVGQQDPCILASIDGGINFFPAFATTARISSNPSITGTRAFLSGYPATNQGLYTTQELLIQWIMPPSFSDSRVSVDFFPDDNAVFTINGDLVEETFVYGYHSVEDMLSLSANATLVAGLNEMRIQLTDVYGGDFGISFKISVSFFGRDDPSLLCQQDNRKEENFWD